MSVAAKWRKRDAVPEFHFEHEIAKVTRDGFSIEGEGGDHSFFVASTDDRIVEFGKWLIETFEEK